MMFGAQLPSIIMLMSSLFVNYTENKDATDIYPFIFLVLYRNKIQALDLFQRKAQPMY